MEEIVLKAAIAAALTLLLERSPRIYESWNIRRKHFALLGDDWRGYHFSFKHGEPSLFESRWLIKKGWLTPFSARFSIGGVLEYKGDLTLEGEDRLIFYGKAKTQDETVIFRFPNPLLTTSDVVRGLWLSYDHDKHLASGGFLLTRKKLSEEDARTELRKIETASYIDGGLPLIRVIK